MVAPVNTKIMPKHPELPRIDWVDVVKGLSIFLVVMMHSTLGVQNAVGESSWMGALVEFARPFRIPCFMLISGLFLHRSIHGEWRQFFDRKILHFAYFYLLWVTIQVVVKAPSWMGEGQGLMDIARLYLTTFVQPFGTLWFIYMLPVFYIVTRMLRNIDWRILLGLAVVLQILPIHCGSLLVDEFASRYVFFVIGYLFHRQFFTWAEFVGKNFMALAGFVFIWAGVNFLLVNQLPLFNLDYLAVATGAGPIVKLADMPFIALGLGIAGAMAMIALARLITNFRVLDGLRWVGSRSIVIYLAFFLPMGVSRIILVKFAGEYLSTGVISLLVTLTAFIGPLIFYGLVKLTGIGGFLFERPRFARLGAQKTGTATAQPAE